jgi:ribosomal protein S27AE
VAAAGGVAMTAADIEIMRCPACEQSITLALWADGRSRLLCPQCGALLVENGWVVALEWKQILTGQEP